MKLVTEHDIGQGLHIADNKLKAKLSATEGNILQLTDDGLFAEIPTNTPVAAEPSVQVVKHYLTINSTDAVQGDNEHPDRAVLQVRNGLAILHLDFKMKADTNGRRKTVATLRSGSPRFESLTEVQVNNGLGSIYIEGNGTRVYTQGQIPANTRYIIDLIGFTR